MTTINADIALFIPAVLLFLCVSTFYGQLNDDDVGKS